MIQGLKIRSSPQISWLLIGKKQFLRWLQFANPTSIQQNSQSQRVQVWLKVKFLCSLLLFPSLLPRLSIPLESEHGKRGRERGAGTFLFVGHVSEWLCNLWSSVWSWISLSFSVGSTEKPCWASLLSGNVAPSPQSWWCLSQPVSPAGFTLWQAPS